MALSDVPPGFAPRCPVKHLGLAWEIGRYGLAAGMVMEMVRRGFGWVLGFVLPDRVAFWVALPVSCFLGCLLVLLLTGVDPEEDV